MCCRHFLLLCLLGLSGPFGLAQEPVKAKALPYTELERIAVDTLKEVHNRGADLYNVADAAGAYNTFRAALQTVSPFLAHRPTVQKQIADGLTAADKEPTAKARAFRLHELIEAVRAALLKPEEVKEDPKPLPPPKPVEPLPPPKPMITQGTLAGVVTLEDKPMAEAVVYLVSLDAADGPRVYNAKCNAQGEFDFAEPLPFGKYVVLIDGPATVPVVYRLSQTSPLEYVHREAKASKTWNLQPK